jgi:hypothetical protein
VLSRETCGADVPSLKCERWVIWAKDGVEAFELASVDRVVASARLLLREDLRDVLLDAREEGIVRVEVERQCSRGENRWYSCAARRVYLRVHAFRSLHS